MAIEGRTHRPVVNSEKCGLCAVCIRGCPAETIPYQRREVSSLRGLIYRNVYQDIPPEPQVNAAKVFDMPPCQLACPIHQDARGYLALIAGKRYAEAMALIRQTNCLPSVCGYVCHHPCEEACLRRWLDEPLSIRSLKKFVADFDDGRLKPAVVNKRQGKKVSIIGSGPAGLAAACDLAAKGFQVDVIEAGSEPGGMLRYAIPAFRLPRHILDRDIKYIEAMGVVIKTGLRFGVDISLTDLKKNDSSAIIMAIGTHQSIEMGIKGEKDDTKGYIDCLTFLRKYASGQPVNIDDKVVVVGGGNAAIDSARTALRSGAKEVEIIYRRSYQEMPADREEIKEAEVEGVKISYLTMPTRIITEDGEVRRLECVRTELGNPDDSGRRVPIPVAASDFTVSAPAIISCVGQRPDLSWNREKLPFQFSPRNTFIVDDNLRTNMEGVFAAGDAVNGTTTVVEAMASGKRAAASVALYLSEERQ